MWACECARERVCVRVRAPGHVCGVACVLRCRCVPAFVRARMSGCPRARMPACPRVLCVCVIVSDCVQLAQLAARLSGINTCVSRRLPPKLQASRPLTSPRDQDLGKFRGPQSAGDGSRGDGRAWAKGWRLGHLARVSCPGEGVEGLTALTRMAL